MLSKKSGKKVGKSINVVIFSFLFKNHRAITDMKKSKKKHEKTGKKQRKNENQHCIIEEQKQLFLRICFFAL